MKLTDIQEKYINMNLPTGTYVGVRFDDDSKSRINDLMTQLKLEKPIPLDKLHSTVVYSDKKRLDGFKSQGDLGYGKKPFTAIPKNFTLFPNSEGDTNCLVIELESDFLKDRNSNIVNKYGVEQKFPDYRPHITLSYDYNGDLPDDELLKSLGEITLDHEYDEPLDDEFVNKL